MILQKVEDIYKEFTDVIHKKIHDFAEGGRYKYKIYLDVNPELHVSPFINNLHPLCRNIIRFRLGSHCLPIETGRWSRVTREQRLCETCNVLVDEHHVIYHCTCIERDDVVLSPTMSEIWTQKDIFKLVAKLKNTKIFGDQQIN